MDRKFIKDLIRSVDNSLGITRAREERAWVKADPLFSAVYVALEDERFRWRTANEVASQLGIKPGLVESSIYRLSHILDNVCRSSHKTYSGEELYATRDQYRKVVSPLNRFLATVAFKIGY